MKKYDIGILTFWNVPNYGTFAQAYALQRVIDVLAINRDVKQINHLDEKHYNAYYDRCKYFRSFSVLSKNYWRSFLPLDDSSKKNKAFISSYNLIPHTDLITNTNINEYSFNTIILGSDIVWDYSMTLFNRDTMLFGVGFNSPLICSYAASFGTIRQTDIYPDYVKESIQKMSYITVRDNNSARIVEKITGSKPPVVLDPAWMWEFENDNNIVVPNESDYLLVYGCDFTNSFIVETIKFARDMKLKIIALDCNNDKYSWCDKLIKQGDISPFEWIGYFKGASYVSTSTFHGLTFSLIFKKKFAFCKSDFILAKVDEFLKELNLYSILVENTSAFKMFMYEWDYKYISSIIDIKRKESNRHLIKIIDSDFYCNG